MSALFSGATLGVLTTPEQALCSGGLANTAGTPRLYLWVLLSSGWWVLFTVLRQRRNVKLSEWRGWTWEELGKGKEYDEIILYEKLKLLRGVFERTLNNR